MNLYLRLLKLLLLLPFVPRRDPFAESRVAFRVWPNDCDLNLHMNNGRYLTVMDLGRLHFVAQTGLLRHLFRRRWRPVMSAVDVNFVRALRPFQKFEVVTRLLTWDEKYFYAEHRIESGEALYAIATTRGLFLEGRRTVPTEEVLRALGVNSAPPPMPAVVRHWRELTALKREHSARLS